MKTPKVRIGHDDRFVTKTTGDLVTTGVFITCRLSKHLLKNVLYYFLFSSLPLFLHPLIANAQTGNFSATGSMVTTRAGHTATLLSNGEVLMAGGCNTDCIYVAVASAELYNPAAGTFTATGSMSATRFDGQTATLLANGKVLVAGGYSTNYVVAVPNAELYDPATGTFSAAGPMNAVRYFHTATLLPNGKVLVAGGCLDTGGSCEMLASAELYDPATGAFSATGTMSAGRGSATATLLHNGKVLVAGGADFSSSVSLASAELYDPATGTFSTTGSMTTGRGSHSAALLPNGKVLVATGYDYFSSSTLLSAELYDPVSGTFSTTGSMTTGRIYQSAALLANGEFLVVGGAGSSGPIASAELFDPTTGAFSATGSLITGRWSATATLLPNGKILVAGGKGDSVALASAELYTSAPKYEVCVLYDQTRSVKSGAVFPIKLYLCDTGGNDVSSSSIVLQATQITGISSYSGPAESPGNANPDNDFRFDSTLGPAGGYIFNLGTSGLASGTYSLHFMATGDSGDHVVMFGVK
jgi:hypothetical protein